MGSGSKSRVRVGFGYCFSGSGRVRVYTFGFLSGSGNFSRVRVGFSGFKIWNFWPPQQFLLHFYAIMFFKLHEDWNIFEKKNNSEMKNISFHVKNFLKKSSVIFAGKIRTFLEFLEWNMGYLERNSETWKNPGFSGFECRVSGIGQVSIFGFG